MQKITCPRGKERGLCKPCDASALCRLPSLFRATRQSSGEWLAARGNQKPAEEHWLIMCRLACSTSRLPICRHGENPPAVQQERSKTPPSTSGLRPAHERIKCTKQQNSVLPNMIQVERNQKSNMDGPHCGWLVGWQT